MNSTRGSPTAAIMNSSNNKAWITYVIALLLLLQIAVIYYISPTVTIQRMLGNPSPIPPPLRHADIQTTMSSSPKVDLEHHSNKSTPNKAHYIHVHRDTTYNATASPTTNGLKKYLKPITTDSPKKVFTETQAPSSSPTINSHYTLQPPNVRSLPNWKPGTFCDDYIGHALRKPLAMCGNEPRQEDSLKCTGSPENSQMATCSVQNLALEPRKLQSKMWDCDACEIVNSDSLHLIHDDTFTCQRPNMDKLAPNTERNDPVHRVMKEVIRTSAVPSESCKTWINKTAYFFHSQRYHIYFRMFSYYNLYKTIVDRAAEMGSYIVVRMSESEKYMFGDYERSLFPELITLGDLPDERVCFREVVIAPWTYACVIFRCKMEGSTKQRCLQCDGRGLYGTTLLTFRTRALQACSLTDQTPEERKGRPSKSIVFVKRKPYIRWKGDYNSNFQRVLSNQDELINELKKAFPQTVVHDVFMEDIDLCEQMRLVHDCDVYMGVHGAGLVHSWWLHEDALLLELVPPSHAAIPSFATLTKLAGRRYKSFRIGGSTYRVSVDARSVINMLKEVSNLS